MTRNFPAMTQIVLAMDPIQRQQKCVSFRRPSFIRPSFNLMDYSPHPFVTNEPFTAFSEEYRKSDFGENYVRQSR